MAPTQPRPSGPAPEFQLKHRLALALEVAGVERDEMAAELGAHKNTIGNYLRGETRPGRAVLRVWALRCGVPFEWLLTGRTPDADGDGGGQVINASGWIHRRARQGRRTDRITARAS